MKRKTLFLFLPLLALGCASKGVVRPTTPLSVKLTEYKSLAVNISSTVEKSNLAVVQLENSIVAKLRGEGVFEHIFLASRNSTETADLRLDVKILKLTKVGSVTRALFGAFAGRSHLLADAELIDISKGQKIGSFQIEGKSSGGTVFAGTTEQAVEKAAEEIAKFIRKNVES